ncbi:hypothetical protein [Nitrosomonas oligotropha]|uniref:Uncharacterized protein n=1 Tax=Nitrosomonas oligotropha TaxID=42354 RepID=A0A1H8RPN9_9PROT|nr:hypothetical protein [Nitrosomonas oligotropha]SDX03887.1 hypothetical protein SAMN05216300_11633 [Nitrosomonas oligotropha]SEO68350.1 hypothetical protein SAMN05216333_11533 [Nitrosomonas oligotropha]
MNNTLTTVRTQHAELLTRRAKFDQKKRDCESLVASITSKLSGLEQAHSILEKRYLADEANLAQVTASRNEIEAKRVELSEAERLASLAAEAIREIDQQILQAELATTAARREFCVKRSNDLLNEIKTDAKLRARIIEAMAARAASGSGGYTFSVAYFAQHHFSAIFPEISETEVRAAVDQFTKSNDLD